MRITEGFAETEPADPVKYDFALSRIEILENCTGQRLVLYNSADNIVAGGAISWETIDWACIQRKKIIFLNIIYPWGV